MQAFLLIFRRLASLTAPMHVPKITARSFSMWPGSYFYTHEPSNCHNSGSTGPKISIRDQIQGLDASYLMEWVMLLTILTLVLAGNSNAFLIFLHFVGLKGQYTPKLLLGLENRLKTKFFACIKKLQKCE